MNTYSSEIEFVIGVASSNIMYLPDDDRRHLFDVKTNHKSFFSTSLNITHCCCIFNVIG